MNKKKYNPSCLIQWKERERERALETMKAPFTFIISIYLIIASQIRTWFDILCSPLSLSLLPLFSPISFSCSLLYFSLVYFRVIHSFINSIFSKHHTSIQLLFFQNLFLKSFIPYSTINHIFNFFPISCNFSLRHKYMCFSCL